LCQCANELKIKNFKKMKETNTVVFKTRTANGRIALISVFKPDENIVVILRRILARVEDVKGGWFPDGIPVHRFKEWVILQESNTAGTGCVIRAGAMRMVDFTRRRTGRGLRLRLSAGAETTGTNPGKIAFGRGAPVCAPLPNAGAPACAPLPNAGAPACASRNIGMSLANWQIEFISTLTHWHIGTF
jgi:hypothetical protein